MKNIFITATDTDAGKTFVSCAIIHALTQQYHQRVAAYKPVSAGCELINGELVNDDAKWLTHYANCQQSLKQVNPIAFLEPIAPHIAAQKHQQAITVSDLSTHFTQINALNADINLIEGAGGWRLPLIVANSAQGTKNTTQFMADFVKAQKMDVILIVNMKLGCLNHALLTFDAIKADGLNCIAWVANCASETPMSNLAENIESLTQLLPIPKIAQVDFIADAHMNIRAGQGLTFTDKIKIAAESIDVSILLPQHKAEAKSTPKP
ncbi:dethiobiotin synthase [Colwellia asteriadis]|uniref:ATP-dependent dethiobiotin synthetase BioD n=1 Tax=Colwellia asteriadis TaxID=517723 RepID=A0ABP3WI17_9GAMM